MLIKVEDEPARLWYMEEAIKENWSTRALERQINSFYYQRLLSIQEKEPVRQEAKEKTSELNDPRLKVEGHSVSILTF